MSICNICRKEFSDDALNTVYILMLTENGKEATLAVDCCAMCAIVLLQKLHNNNAPFRTIDKYKAIHETICLCNNN